MTVSSVESCGFVVTDGAVSKIKAVLEQEERPSLFRLAVHGGGCAGFRYEFSTENVDNVGSLASEEDDEPIDDSDLEFEDEDEEEYGEEEVGGGSDLLLSDESGVPILLIDGHSRKLLKNSTIDYVEDINGSRFVVSNPAMKFGCGCGSSFSL